MRRVYDAMRRRADARRNPYRLQAERCRDPCTVMRLGQVRGLVVPVSLRK